MSRFSMFPVRNSWSFSSASAPAGSGDLFKVAKSAAPAIIFIDEIDAVGRHRGTGLGGGNDEREQTLNQILVEMDGFEPHEKVIVIAATNRPDVLDPALLRPGRFDRRVFLDLPDIKGRKEILNIHSKGKPLAEDVTLDLIAERTPGFSGADLQNLMNEAAILAAREERKKVSQFDLIRSIEKVLLGPERKKPLIDGGRKENRFLSRSRTCFGFFRFKARRPGAQSFCCFQRPSWRDIL